MLTYFYSYGMCSRFLLRNEYEFSYNILLSIFRAIGDFYYQRCILIQKMKRSHDLFFFIFKLEIKFKGDLYISALSKCNIIWDRSHVHYFFNLYFVALTPGLIL